MIAGTLACLGIRYFFLPHRAAATLQAIACGCSSVIDATLNVAKPQRPDAFGLSLFSFSRPFSAHRGSLA